MFLAALIFVLALPAAAADRRGFALSGAHEGWAEVLGSMGLAPSPPSRARVIVATAGAPAEWLAKMDDGAVVVLEGDSATARAFGIVAERRKTRVSRILDAHDPKLHIWWKQALDVPVFRLPDGARVLATAYHGRAPLMAGITRGRGAALWLAVSPGADGYERFPFLPQALADLGVRPEFESRNLWAFFDVALRDKSASAEALAARWRQSGIAAVHVGAWDYFESNEENDRFLRELIAACRRRLVLVYAWLELPHVSDQFWEEHPAWRDKTARFKDAHVDWRMLMNLANPACRDAVRAGIRAMLARFDWDGVNLAELYFDGVDGLKKLAEFTPLNDDVRREVKTTYGFDPADLFRGRGDPARMRTFLDYRAGLAARLQEEWIDELERSRIDKAGLDLVLTHVDDRFDPRMHDAIGADAARALKMLDDHAMTFLIEDPATVWRLGPKRYAEIARRYAPLTKHQQRLSVDINIVDRYGRVYPTAKQTGAELVELFHTAAESFARVAFYSAGTVAEVDVPWLAACGAVVSAAEQDGGRLTVESPRGVGVRLRGPSTVDGKPWPVQDAQTVWLPPGRHVIEAAEAAPALRIEDFNGNLEGARVAEDGIEIGYLSESRAFALVSQKPVELVIDGRTAPFEAIARPDGRCVVPLPRGEHRARLR